MLPSSNLLKAGSGQDSVCLSGNTAQDFRLLGTTARSSIALYDVAQSATFAMDKDGNGIIALCVNSSGDRQTPLLLKMTRNETSMWVELGSGYIPPGDKLLQAHYGHLTCTLPDGTLITSQQHNLSALPAGTLVVDGNTICRFVADEIDLDAVREKAHAIAEEENLTARLRKEAQQASDRCRHMQGIIAAAFQMLTGRDFTDEDGPDDAARYGRFLAVVMRHGKIVQLLEKKLEVLKRIKCSLADFVRRKWFKGEAGASLTGFEAVLAELETACEED